MKISLYEQTVRVDAENNKTHLSSGTICKRSEMSCVDSENGLTFWENLPVDRCNFKKYSILKEELFDKHEETDTNQVILKITDPKVSFALAVTRKEKICGYSVLRTELPKLMIF